MIGNIVRGCAFIALGVEEVEGESILSVCGDDLLMWQGSAVKVTGGRGDFPVSRFIMSFQDPPVCFICHVVCQSLAGEL